MDQSSRWLLALILILYLLYGQIDGQNDFSNSQDEPIAEARARESCSFPKKWEGSWFQSGVHQNIFIKGKSISTKGRCLEADGEKYLVYNEKENCYRCVVFHEKHINVLQYKETFCLKDRGLGLRSICSTITGDANLFSMFRLDATPIDCPFQGSYTFTYDRGHGECSYPKSNIDSCILPSKLLLSYQACPNVPGTESTEEELQCIATWKEGLSSKYLLGLIQYRHPSSYEDRFRCFVYEKNKKFGSNSSTDNSFLRVAQSGDATCNGLTPMEGSRTLTLKRAPVLKSCKFPNWLQTHAQWFTLDQRSTFVFTDSGLRVSNSSDINRIAPITLSMSAVCSQIVEDRPMESIKLLLHSTSECRSGYICTNIYRRDGHIVELQMGKMARRLEDACHISYFDPSELPYITLVSSTPESRECPYLGRFEVTGLLREGRRVRNTCKDGFHTLNVGCSTLDKLSFTTKTGCTPLSEYSCHGGWEEMGLSYLITTPMSRSSNGARRFCFVFRETSVQPQPRKSVKSSYGRYDEDDDDDEVISSDSISSSMISSRVLQFSSISDSCQRNIQPGIEGTLAFNVTSYGRCDDYNRGQRSRTTTSIMSLILFILIANYSIS